MDIQRGMRGRLSDRFDIAKPLVVTMKTIGSAEYDSCCFGVDEADQLSDDRYMVFYNQPASPGGEIAWRQSEGGGEYEVSLCSLPESIRKLVFTVSIDGEGTMGQIESFEVSIAQEGCEPLVLRLTGGDFADEKAIISIEMYIKGEWRFSAVAQGFNGGLSDLLEEYGGEEADEPDEQVEPTEELPEPEVVPVPESVPESVSEPVPEPEPAPLDLEKHAPEPAPLDLEKPAPEPAPLDLEKPVPEPETALLDLEKPALLDLEKPKPAPEPERMSLEKTAEAPKISLVKLGGKRIDLKKDDQVGLINANDEPITHFIVGLGWDVGPRGGIDCDASAFLCREGRLRSGNDIVCFTNLRHESGAVIHSGDNLTGEGAGDDERIIVDLMKLPPEYDRVVFVANIFLSRITREHFGMVRNGYIRICDQKLNELCRFRLTNNSEYDKMRAMIFGEINKIGGIWVFRAIGTGTKDHSIKKLAKHFKK